MTATQFNK